MSIIHVGENTGRLDDAFLQLAEYLEREQETRKQIKVATRYPIFVLIALAVAFVVLKLSEMVADTSDTDVDKAEDTGDGQV